MCHRPLLARLQLFLGDFHSIVLYQINAVFVAQPDAYTCWNIQMSVLKNMQWLETLSCIIALSVVCRGSTLSFSVDLKFRLTLPTNMNVLSAWQLLLSFALNKVWLVWWLVFIYENEVKYIDLCLLKSKEGVAISIRCIPLPFQFITFSSLHNAEKGK